MCFLFESPAESGITFVGWQMMIDYYSYFVVWDENDALNPMLK